MDLGWGQCATAPVVVSGGGVGNFFNSSWQNVPGAAGLGCGLTPLKDNVWTDYGGPGICSEGPGGGAGAEITTDQFVNGYGTRSCRVWQMPGNVNGTDFRINYDHALLHVPVYYRWYIRWGNNWHFGSSDHKMMIQGGPDAIQYIYFNIRADFSSGYNPNAGRICFHNNPLGTVWTDNRVSRLVVKNTWYRVEAKVTPGVAGVGAVEMRLDGIPCVFTLDGGSADINNMPVCPAGINTFKLDSTYNDGASITTPMDQYWAAMAVSTTDWIGA